MPQHTLDVGPDHEGLRLDKFLANELPNHSRAQVQRLIDDGRVSLPRVATPKANTAVRPGDVVTVEVPAPAPSALEPEDLPLPILHDDADVVVVNKPAGLVVHPGAGHPTGTLVHALLHHVQDLSGIGGETRPGIVHRLDKGTSGLMVVARTQTAYHALVDQLSVHEVERNYETLVWGWLDTPVGTIDAPIGRSRRNPLLMTVSADGRPSRTHYEVVERCLEPALVTRMRCSLETGRTHQIRVHLRSIGHPVVGDDLYSGQRPALGLARPFLHAFRLAFAHPATDETVSFTAELPSDLVAVLDRLEPAPDLS